MLWAAPMAGRTLDLVRPRLPREHAEQRAHRDERRRLARAAIAAAIT
jgi:hypothetical protein